MNRKLIITTSIILLAALGFFAVMIFSENLYRLKQIQDKEPDIIRAYEPSFRHDGYLYFIAENNDTLCTIDIEIADDNREREQGLMFRKTMQENQGMLFIFDQPAEQNFWMKNTIMPLDILYADSGMQIIALHQNTRPYSEELIPSYEPAQYTVEVVAGYCSKYGIKSPMKITFKRRDAADPVQ